MSSVEWIETRINWENKLRGEDVFLNSKWIFSYFSS